MHNELDKLTQLLAKLPGLGPRSARRAVIHMLKKKDSYMPLLASTIKKTMDVVQNCGICGNFDSVNPCGICTNKTRDRSVICVVEDVSDLWAFERGSIFNGQYHIIGGTLSALEGIGPENLNIAPLLERVKKQDVTEVIIATNATVDGQTTAFYLTERIAEISNVKVTKLGHGIPVGGELDYLDEGTLSASLSSRKEM